MLAFILVASLWINLAQAIRLLQAARDLRRARATKDELIDVNASVIRESCQRGEVILSLRDDSRRWRGVAGLLSDELRGEQRRAS